MINNYYQEGEAEEDISKSDTEQVDSELKSEDNTSDSVSSYIHYIGETHTPNNSATNVQIEDWSEDEDYDICGETHVGGQKITIYNMFSALEGNNGSSSNKIISELNYTLNKKEIQKASSGKTSFAGKFVVGNETNGSPSTVKIYIFIDGEKVYSSGKIDCFDTEIKPFNINILGKKKMVIKIICNHRGNPFVIGIVDK